MLRRGGGGGGGGAGPTPMYFRVFFRVFLRLFFGVFWFSWGFAEVAGLGRPPRSYKLSGAGRLLKSGLSLIRERSSANGHEG